MPGRRVFLDLVEDEDFPAGGAKGLHGTLGMTGSFQARIRHQEHARPS